jgi:hypothetical protein
MLSYLDIDLTSIIVHFRRFHPKDYSPLTQTVELSQS